MKIQKKKDADVHSIRIHIACTKSLNKRLDDASRSKELTKSDYARMAINEMLKKDGF